MADSNIQTLDTVKPITLDEYQERTAHLQENTTSLLSTIADKQVQAAGLATQAASLASEVNAVAVQASLSFSKKTWTDTATSGTPITAAELNRLENAISSLTTAVNNLQDSVSSAWPVGRAVWLAGSVTPKSLELPGTWESYRWSLTTKVGSVLDVKNGKIDVSGAELQIYMYNNSEAQKWHVYAEGPGQVTLWIRTA